MTQTGIPSGNGLAAGEEQVVRLHDLLGPSSVKIPLIGRKKRDLLHELVHLAVRGADLGSEEEQVYRAVQAREDVLSTGIGDGIALPHAKYGSLDDVVMAAGVSAVPVDFDALDGRPVQLFFLMLGPESAAGVQVRLLSRISRLMRDDSLRSRLISAPDAGRFLAILREAERGI